LTNLEKIRTRIVLAQSIDISPDEVTVMDSNVGITLYVLDDYKGYNLALCFDNVPTVEQARQNVKDLYLNGIEWEFDEEMKTIN
jgi:hypothetical protein